MADDTNRVIRDEAAKTRRLLVWLLVGVPTVALIVFLIVISASATQPGGTVPTTTVMPTGTDGCPVGTTADPKLGGLCD